jgi:hypothetical protein
VFGVGEDWLDELYATSADAAAQLGAQDRAHEAVEAATTAGPANVVAPVPARLSLIRSGSADPCPWAPRRRGRGRGAVSVTISLLHGRRQRVGVGERGRCS